MTYNNASVLCFPMTWANNNYMTSWPQHNQRCPSALCYSTEEQKSKQQCALKIQSVEEGTSMFSEELPHWRQKGDRATQKLCNSNHSDQVGNCFIHVCVCVCVCVHVPSFSSVWACLRAKCHFCQPLFPSDWHRCQRTQALVGWHDTLSRGLSLFTTQWTYAHKHPLHKGVQPWP